MTTARPQAASWDPDARDSAPLRVLMLDSESSWRGGQNQLALLLRGLREHGVFARVAAPPQSAILKSNDARGFESVPLRMRHGMDVVAATRLARHLRRETYDIVHCHSSHAHSTAFLALWPSRLVGSGNTPPERPRLVVSRRVAFPLARHGPAALKYRNADLFLAISSGVRDVLVHGGVDAERVALVPSGVDLDILRARRDRLAVRRELGLSPNATVVGTVAALTKNKAVHDLVQALRFVAEHVQDVRLLVVGEGPARAEIETLVERLGLRERVVLLGFRDDVLDMLAAFDCFCLPSRVEGLGTSIMDAQTLGVPVVATRTGGVPDLVDDGETGLLVPPGNPDLLGGALVRMLRDPGLRARCVERARQGAGRYDYRNMVRDTLSAYHALVRDTAGPPA